MRIHVSIDDLTAEQWRWVNAIWRPEPPDGNDVRACAVLVGPEGIDVHIEVSMAEFIIAIGELVRLDRLGHLAEAALTPDAFADRPPRTPAPINDDLESHP